MAGLVLDAGPLIKLEGRYPIALALIKEAKQRGAELLIAGAAYTEIWRGHRNGAGTPMSIALKNVKPVRTTETIGKLAGELLQKASLDGTYGFDAIVVATAALRGAEVVTGDPADIAGLPQSPASATSSCDNHKAWREIPPRNAEAAFRRPRALLTKQQGDWLQYTDR